MNSELPSHLQSTRDLLTGSLGIHQADQASAMPEDLMTDLVNRFHANAPVNAQVPAISWFEKVQSFIARPAFGVAALAVVIIGLALPGMMSPTATTNTTFRGAATLAAPDSSARIILVHAPSDVVSSLENSGDFEQGAISSVADISASETGARVVVDFKTSKISIINADGETTSTEAIPADNATLSLAIASALSRL